jgi:hypothetical protein
MTEQARETARGELAAVVEDALVAWRRAHPLATLDEIVDAVDAELGPLRARYVADLAQEAAEGDRVCARCGGRLRQRGRRTREVLLPGQARPLRLERDYLVCSSCGAGVFPPG